jgi:hypothetical protein
VGFEPTMPVFELAKKDRDKYLLIFQEMNVRMELAKDPIM